MQRAFELTNFEARLDAIHRLMSRYIVFTQNFSQIGVRYFFFMEVTGTTKYKQKKSTRIL